MNKQNQQIDGVHIKWNFPEVEENQKSQLWYIVAGVLALGCLIFAVVTGSFLFAGIIVMASFIYVYSSFYAPHIVEFAITEEGIRVGQTFFKYKDLDSFCIFFEPDENLKEICFDFRSGARPSLTIPLKDADPIKVRKILLNYLPENLEKEEESMFDTLTRYFRL